MSLPPTAMVWEGDVMRPTHARLADSRFVIGETYLLVPWDDRSDASHKHAFAWINEAWKSLPEHLSDQYPSPTHLRKRALIDAGYYDETVIDAGSKAAALRVAAAMRAIPGEEFTLIVTRGQLVVRRTAQSMARGRMDRETFNAAKQAVLETIAAMIGVEPARLEQARPAA